MHRNLTVPEIGHNLVLPDAERLHQQLVAENGDLIARRDELLGSLMRFHRDHEVIETEELAKTASDCIKQLTGCGKSAKALRVAAKEPYLTGGRVVDGFFMPIETAMKEAQASVDEKLGPYQRRKKDEEQRVRDEAARKAREEAERAEREAKRLRLFKSKDETAANEARAAEAQEAARKAQKAADVKAADLSRTRGDLGAVASLRTTWTFEITDYEAIPLETLRPHIPRAAIEQAIRSFIKADGRQLGGVRIFEQHQTVVR